MRSTFSVLMLYYLHKNYTGTACENQKTFAVSTRKCEHEQSQLLNAILMSPKTAVKGGGRKIMGIGIIQFMCI